MEYAGIGQRAQRKIHGNDKPCAGSHGLPLKPAISTTSKARSSRNINNQAKLKGHGVPWHPLELLDDSRRADKDERSTKSQAKKKMRELKPLIKSAWAEIQKEDTILEKIAVEYPAAVKQAREFFFTKSKPKS